MTGRLAGRRILLLLPALLLAAGAGADERLTLPRPEGWRTLDNLVTDRIRSSEFAIPRVDGEADEFDKLTFEWFDHELAPGLDPLDVAEQLAGRIRNACHDARDEPVFAGMENGYPTVVRLLVCPERKDGSGGEVLMIKTIQGASGHWILIRGRPVAAFERTREVLDADTIRRWTGALRTISLCDPESEGHPCP